MLGLAISSSIHRLRLAQPPAVTRYAAIASAAILVTAGLTGCAGGRSARRAPDRTAFAAPTWFNSPQKGNARFLYFLGSANGASDESTARELAVQKALYELSVFCGANLTTDFRSVEVEKNGQLNQEVTLAVDVAGEEIAIREAATEKWVVGKGSDGSYDAYVRIRWPRSEYKAIQVAKREQAERALALLLKAETATDDYRIADAHRFLRETKQALGPVKGQIRLNHPKYSNSGLVFDAATALGDRLREIDRLRKKKMAVSVLCYENDGAKDCASRWVGAVRQRATQAGFKVAANDVSRGTTAAILDSRNPDPDAAMRSSAYVLAVKYDARLSGTDGGFVFVRCGARAVVFDTDQKKILHVGEVKPLKGGHVDFPGAVKKACSNAEKEVTAWIDQHVGALQGSP